LSQFLFATPDDPRKSGCQDFQHDSFIMTQNISSVYQNLKSGSGQIQLRGQLYRSPELPDARFTSVRAGAKIAPACPALRDGGLPETKY
jgi:hypothetical protein